MLRVKKIVIYQLYVSFSFLHDLKVFILIDVIRFEVVDKTNKVSIKTNWTKLSIIKFIVEIVVQYNYGAWKLQNLSHIFDSRPLIILPHKYSVGILTTLDIPMNLYLI